jgi:hypothetical protein
MKIIGWVASLLVLLAVAGYIGLAQSANMVFVSCDRNGDPWYDKYCIQTEAQIRTTVTLRKVDTTLSFVLFDNILDRDCLLAFRSQPGFWQGETRGDSSELVLPFPALPSGQYRMEVRAEDRLWIDTLVIMR